MKSKAIIIKKFENGLTLEGYPKSNGNIALSLNKVNEFSENQKMWINMFGLFLETKFERFIYPTYNGKKLTELHIRYFDSYVKKLTYYGEIIDSMDGEIKQCSPSDVLHEEYMDVK